MKLIATKLSPQERWANEINQRAWKCKQRMTERERQAIELAYSVKNEQAWGVADSLLVAVDAPAGQRWKRVMLVKKLEGLL